MPCTTPVPAIGNMDFSFKEADCGCPSGGTGGGGVGDLQAVTDIGAITDNEITIPSAIIAGDAGYLQFVNTLSGVIGSVYADNAAGVIGIQSAPNGGIARLATEGTGRLDATEGRVKIGNAEVLTLGAMAADPAIGGLVVNGSMYVNSISGKLRMLEEGIWQNVKDPFTPTMVEGSAYISVTGDGSILNPWYIQLTDAGLQTITDFGNITDDWISVQGINIFSDIQTEGLAFVVGDTSRNHLISLGFGAIGTFIVGNGIGNVASPLFLIGQSTGLGSNTTDMMAIGNSAGSSAIGNTLLFIGQNAGASCQGDRIIGISTGTRGGGGNLSSQLGSDLIAIGPATLDGNIGDRVISIGGGTDIIEQDANSFDDVILFGFGAEATDTEQFVVRTGASQWLISAGGLTDNREYTAPNANGTLVLSVNGTAPNAAGDVTIGAVPSDSFYTEDGALDSARTVDMATLSLQFINAGLFRIVNGDNTYDFNDSVSFMTTDASNAVEFTQDLTAGNIIAFRDLVTPANDVVLTMAEALLEIENAGDTFLKIKDFATRPNGSSLVLLDNTTGEVGWGAGSIVKEESFTATAGQTVFNLSTGTPGSTAKTLVFRNGVFVSRTVVGTAVTIAACDAGDEVVINFAE